MFAFILAFLVSLIVTLLVVRYSHLHHHMTADFDIKGVQKFHTIPVPRVGGIGLIIGVLSASLARLIQSAEVGSFVLLLLGCSMPAFLMGFFEDITKKISVKTRLLATGTSAVLTGYVFGAWIQSLQIIVVDSFMQQYSWLTIVFTCFAVTGVANAFNIIDGYNGLAGMVGVIVLAGVAYVAFQVSDYSIMIAALSMMGAILGFFVWNYPRGLIFLGDGGAYLIGFWIAELSVLLKVRHQEVSVWFPMLLCFYPIFETLFTIYRRVFVSKAHPGMPDAAHLHQIIYKRVVRWSVGSSQSTDKMIRNALTAPYLWLLTSFSAIPAVLFWRETWVLQLLTCLFAICYVFLYRRLVRFRVPKWLVVRVRKDL